MADSNEKEDQEMPMEIVSEWAADQISDFMAGERKADSFVWSDEDGSYMRYDEIRFAVPHETAQGEIPAVEVQFCYRGEIVARMQRKSSVISVGGLLGTLNIKPA